MSKELLIIQVILVLEPKLCQFISYAWKLIFHLNSCCIATIFDVQFFLLSLFFSSFSVISNSKKIVWLQWEFWSIHDIPSDKTRLYGPFILLHVTMLLSYQRSTCIYRWRKDERSMVRKQMMQSTKIIGVPHSIIIPTPTFQLIDL